MRHKARLERMERQMEARAETTVELVVRECTCCSDGRVILHGGATTFLPRKASGRDAWLESWVGSEAHVAEWRRTHFRKEVR
jgi:hypothetical protein